MSFFDLSKKDPRKEPEFVLYLFFFDLSKKDPRKEPEFVLFDRDRKEPE